MDLVHLGSARFHICRRGAATPILNCYTHLVVRADLAAHVFALCPGYIIGVVADVKQLRRASLTTAILSFALPSKKSMSLEGRIVSGIFRVTTFVYLSQ